MLQKAGWKITGASVALAVSSVVHSLFESAIKIVCNTSFFGVNSQLATAESYNLPTHLSPGPQMYQGSTGARIYRVCQKMANFFASMNAFTDWAEILHTFNITYYSSLFKISSWFIQW